MKRPTRVVVGPFTYELRWPETVHNDDGSELCGRAEHIGLWIAVAKTMPLPLQRKTLLHEIMHACVWVTGHNEDAVTEEQFVRATAFALFEVLRDNPAVTRFITARGS